jgi:hypothetical protein
LQLPKDSASVPGPGQVHGSFLSDAKITQAYNLIRNSSGASKLTDGNLLTVPLNGGLLFVEPTYVSSTNTGGYPRVQYVLAMFGNSIGFSTTLEGALDQVFNVATTSSPGETGGTTTTNPTDNGVGTAQQRLQAALGAAAQAMKDSDAALKKGDFATYGQAQTRLKAALQQAIDAEKALGGTGGGVKVTPSASSPSASPSAGAVTGGASTVGPSASPSAS